MNILKFFSALLPNFERSRIVEDIDLLRSEVKEILVPAYKQAVSVIHGRKYAAPITNNFNQLFIDTLPRYRTQGFIAGTLDFYQHVVEKLDVLEHMVLEQFAKDVTKETLTYRKAAILQYLSAVRFANEYAARSLLRYIAAEQATSTGGSVDSQLTPGELKWLQDNMSGYFQVLKLLTLPTKDIAAALQSVPEITVVPERYDVVKQSVGADALDPLKLNFISARFNPIYFIRQMHAEYQVEHYKRNKEVKRALEFRLLALRLAYEGKQDAKVAQQIEYFEGRIARLSASIAETEAQYA